jgi:hypothetical protein
MVVSLVGISPGERQALGDPGTHLRNSAGRTLGAARPKNAAPITKDRARRLARMRR